MNDLSKIMRLGFAIMVIALCSCSEKKDSSIKMNREMVVQDVYQMLDNYHRDINQNGLAAEFAYLDQSPDFFWVPPGYEVALTYDSVRTILEANSKAFQLVKFHWDTLQIFPLSTNIATYTGIVNTLMIDTAGVESAASIIESGTVINRKSGWKLLSGQSTVLNAE
jgi:hypothetical protein